MCSKLFELYKVLIICYTFSELHFTGAASTNCEDLANGKAKNLTTTNQTIDEGHVSLLQDCLLKQQNALEEAQLNLTNLLNTLKAAQQKQYNFHQFKVNSLNKLNWTEAAESCQGEGHMMATIRSQQDYDKFMTETPKNAEAVNAQFWVGGFDPTNRGQFVWAAEPGEGLQLFSYLSWAPGQPRRTVSTEYDECVLTEAGNWTVAPCSLKNFYVCQYFSTPLMLDRPL